MIAFVGQPGATIEEVRGLDNKHAGRFAMLDELVSDPVVNAQMEDHLEFTGLVWDFEHGKGGVSDSPLLKNYYKNTDAAKGIALAEYTAIAYLLYQ